MTDTSVFARLKRLFSTQAVVRNIGGKKLKVSDTSKRQAFGHRLTVDRYNRVYNAGQYGYGAQSNSDFYASFQQARIQLFRDYDLMDGDALVASVLNIYADECTTKNEFNEILTINSDNDEIKESLKNLFYDILNIEFNLWPWTRNMCKYGDFYLYLMIDPEYGISNVFPLSVYETVRLEGDAETENPFAVKFRIDRESALPFTNKREFENFEIAHFRLLSDTNFMPYGTSLLEAGRRVHKQLRLMEDAMLIHRITRAPDKRVFQIDVGNIPPAEVETYMERVINQVKRQPLLDQNTGEYNMKFNLHNILEDFYLPVRGKDSGTKIDNLQGLTFNAIEDVEYLLQKLQAAFTVPKAFYQYTEDLSGKASLASQDVRFARSIERVQRTLVSELNKIAIVHLYVNGYRDEDLVNFSLSLTNPSMVYELEKINLWKEKSTLSDQLIQGRFLSREWIYKNILELSEEDIVIQQSKIIEDAKFEGNVQRTLQEAQQPPQPQQGMPQQQATQQPVPENDQPDDLFNAEKTLDDIDKLVIIPKKKNGRPPEGHKFRSDSDKLGRDPLGFKEILKAMDVMPKNKQNGKSYIDPRLKESLKDIEIIDSKQLDLLKD